MTRTVLVTGATGTVGTPLRESLADRDVTVRAAARSPPGDGPADEWVAFDFGRPETWGEALSGVDALFLLRPPDASDVRRIGEFVAAADRVGVEHCVVLSVLGADRNPLLPHRRIERRVAATRMARTFLRPSFFAQNLTEVHRDALLAGELPVPAGDGATSFVDARDVGEVAAVALTESGHAGAAYDVTGPAALTYAEVARIATEALGWPVEYTDPSLPRFVFDEVRQGRPPAFALVMAGIYTTARLGLAGRVTDDAERLLDREPRSVREFFEDEAAELRREA
ncbi:SDR family oxidoreductase [Haloarcula litorea]|uniref:SDR family oxidoreductase n=1 Tax=Haloarcula litorea TaxID=3032579 RepID=UPI0023E89A42|nr:SDR family oxidoreductase [Halomicroarcula sp. GDY20]